MRTATCQSRGYASSSRERPPRRTHCSLASPERIPPSWFRVLPRGEPPEASRSARLVADFQHAPRLTLLVARHVARQRSGAQYAHGQRSPVAPHVADSILERPRGTGCRSRARRGSLAASARPRHQKDEGGHARPLRSVSTASTVRGSWPAPRSRSRRWGPPSQMRPRRPQRQRRSRAGR